MSARGILEVGAAVPVMAATGNATEPWGRRPYHRPDCREVTKPGTVRKNWTTYPTALAARMDQRRPCKVCRPA